MVSQFVLFQKKQFLQEFVLADELFVEPTFFISYMSCKNMDNNMFSACNIQNTKYHLLDSNLVFCSYEIGGCFVYVTNATDFASQQIEKGHNSQLKVVT